MPDGRPAPALLTAAQALEYLRLDQGQKDAAHALRRYAAEFGIRTIKLGNAALYPLVELQEFIRRKYSKDNGGATLPQRHQERARQ